MKSGHNIYETNAKPWPTPGGPQDGFTTREPGWLMPRTVRAEGITLYDEHGNPFIDMSSGPVASNLGHGNKRVIEAIQRQVARLPFVSVRQTRTDENIALADRLAEMAGEGFERAYFCSGGSEANETAMKFARQLAFANGERDRTVIFSLRPSYHGGTISAIALSGDDVPAEIFKDMTTISEKLPAPLTYRVPEGLTIDGFEDQIADEFEARIAKIGAKKVLAIFFEPVGGVASGANVLSTRFLKRIRKTCDAHGILMVFDEVMSGAGRTGKFLTSLYHPGAKPDIVVLAKGIGSGYVPLGIMLAPARLVDDLSGKTGYNYGHTSNANPLAMAAGLAVLDELQERKLIENAAKVGDYFKAELWKLAKKHPVIGDVRGKGLLMAVEIVSDPIKKIPFSGEVNAPAAVRRHGLAEGLMIYARRTNAGRYGDWFMAAPPLITTKPDIDDIVARLDKTLKAFANEAVKAGAKVA